MTIISVPYEAGGRHFEGAIVFDEGGGAERPAIFTQPDWKGVCADSIQQARTAAGPHYVMLLADMFGAGYGQTERPQEELRANMLAVHNDIAFTIACGTAARAALTGEASKRGLIDAAKAGAIGFCAGAGFALEQARAGADFRGLVAFHATNPNPVVKGAPRAIRGRVLALHGADDPITPKAQMDALAEELSAAKVDWQIMMFGGAVHSFCDPTVHAGPVRYDARLCRQSFRMMHDFFEETFARQEKGRP